MPHRLSETKVLHNLGIVAPSPIRYYYNWPGQFIPFAPQIDTADFLSRNIRAYCLNTMGCVDADTEYLSPKGWVRIADYQGGDVAQYHPGTGAIEFVPPTEYVVKPCEEMYRLKTKYGLDQLLSPEHRVLLQAKGNPDKQEVVSAAELYQRQEAWVTGETTRSQSRVGWARATIPVTFSTPGGAGLSLTDAELRVQIAVIADGHFATGTRSNRCVLRLKKERKKLRLRALLTTANIPWREVECGSVEGFTVFSFPAPWRTKEFGREFWAATADQLWVVTDEVMHWDGSVSDSKPTERFTSFVKASADFVQYAYAATGRTARIMVQTRERRGRTETCYDVSVRDNGRPLMVCSVTGEGERRRVMTVEPSPDGKKYCFMVPSTFLLFRRNGCIFASGNTGKTISVLWAYDFLKSQRVVDKLLVVAPLSTLERTWGDEIFRNFTHLNFAVLHGSRARRRKLLQEDVDVYIVNHDGLELLTDDLAQRPDIGLVVYDELAVCRNASTDRWKAANVICNKQHPRWVWGLTGTPIPNAPTDAWAQCRLLTPNAVPPYYGRFRDQVMKQVSTYKWIPRQDALEVVYEAMQPSIRFTLEDCTDLPEQILVEREAPLTTDQKKAYDAMAAKLKAEFAGGEILAVNEAVKASKLQQIAVGVAYDTNGDEVVIPATHRLAVLEELIEESEGKVIVFVPFTGALNYVAEFVAKRWPVGVIQGSTSKHARDEVFAGFQRGKEPHVLVAQPATMSHGLTLTAATTIVWFGCTTSNEIWEQANARVRRPGQKRSTVIVQIAGSAIETKTYARLRSKQSTQGLLLDLIKGKEL